MMTIEQLNELIDDQTVKTLEKLKTQQKPRAYWDIVNALLHYFGSTRANVPPMQVCTFIHKCVRDKPEDADRHFEFISAATMSSARPLVFPSPMCNTLT